MPGRKVPKGWNESSSELNLIHNTFLTFKTPIQNRSHCPSEILTKAKTYEKPIRLWIDMTATDKYYNRAEIEEEGIEYVKMKLIGNGKVPRDSDVATFIAHCSDLLEREPNSMIAVHSTSSCNRPGHLICCYLVQKHNFTIQDAIALFEQERPPGINQEPLIVDLLQRYGHAGNSDG